MIFRRPSKHICLAALANSTVEHLATMALQAKAEGYEVCWLDLGHQEGIPEIVLRYSGEQTETVHDARALQRHLKAHRPVAVWLHTPYPEHYPEFFWPIVETWPLAYAPYASGFPSGGWDDGQFGLDTYKKCRWLLATHESMRDGYLKNGIQPERILLTGGPLMFEVQHPSNEPDERNDLLWAPHWMEDYFGKGSFATWRWVAPLLLAHARAHPEMSIVVRPHPFLAKAIDASAPDDVDAADYRALLGLPNVTLSQRSVVDDVLASGALLSEGMSLNVYFATTGKPLGMTRGTIVDFPVEWQKMVDIADELRTPESVAEWLTALPDAPQNPGRREAMAKLVPWLDKSPMRLWHEDVVARSRK